MFYENSNFCLFWKLLYSLHLETGLALLSGSTLTKFADCMPSFSLALIYPVLSRYIKSLSPLDPQPLRAGTCLPWSLLHPSLTNREPHPEPKMIPTNRRCMSTIPQSCQNSNLSRALTFYLIANMSNSQFTEARKKKKEEEESTQVCNLQSKSAQQKYSSSEDSGIQSLLKREKKETHPVPQTFPLYCLQTF